LFLLNLTLHSFEHNALFLFKKQLWVLFEGKPLFLFNIMALVLSKWKTLILFKSSNT